MGLFNKGDQITVTNPIQPTGHKGGETGTVTDTGLVADTEVVEIREDATGHSVGVYPDEISHR